MAHTTDSPNYLLHFADLHIGAGDRCREYRDVFDAAAGLIYSRYSPVETLIVIAGDVFHHKVKYSGEDVDLFYYFLAKLRKYTIVIIPGNHDANLRDVDRMDLIGPLIRPSDTNVYYLRESGAYTCKGLEFYHISVFDVRPREEIAAASPETFAGKIVLYHGMVNASKIGKYTVNNARVSLEMFSRARYVLLGDIHQHQFLTPTAAYPGSLIQQNVTESINKGFIAWSMRTGAGEFVQVHNAKSMIYLDLRGKTPRDVEAKVSELRASLQLPALTAGAAPGVTSGVTSDLGQPTKVTKVNIITDALDSNVTDQVNYIREQIGRVDSVNYVRSTCDATYNEDVSTALGEMLAKSTASPEQIARILALHASKVQTGELTSRGKWYITRMAWRNMYKFGPDNCINFESLQNNISGIIAPNKSGKSSIIDIIVFGIYGEFLRGDKRNVPNLYLKSKTIGGGDDYCVRIDFVVNETPYYVERHESSRGHTAGLFEMREGGVWHNVTGSSVTNTNQKLTRLVGPLNRLFATGLYYYSYDYGDLIKCSRRDRMLRMTDLFGFENKEMVVTEVKNRMRALNTKLTMLRRPNFAVLADTPAPGSADLTPEAGDTLVTACSAEIARLEADTAGLQQANGALSAELATLTAAILAEKVSQSTVELCAKQTAQLVLSQIRLHRARDDLETLLPYAPTRMTARPPAANRQADIDRAEAILRRTMDDIRDVQAIEADISFVNLQLAAAVLPEKPRYTLELLQTKHKAVAARLSQLAETKAEAERASVVGMAGAAPGQKEGLISALTAELDGLQRATSSLRETLTPCMDGTVQALQAKVDAARQQTAYNFAPDCASCAVNRELLAKGLVSAGVELSKAVAARVEVERANGEISGKISALNAEEAAKRLRLAAAVTTIEWEREYNLSLKNRLTVEREMYKLEAYTAATACLAELLAKQRDLAQELAVSLEYADANRIYADSLEFDQFCANEARQALEQEISLRTAEIGQLSAIVKPAAPRIRREPGQRLPLRPSAGLAGRSDAAAAEKCANSVRIATNAEKTAKIAAEIPRIREYFAQYPALHAEYADLKAYHDALTSPSLQLSVIRKNVGKLEETVNLFLKSLTDFQIEMDMTDPNELEIHIREDVRGLDLKICHPITMGSGFQKFVLGLAMRFSLSNISPISSDFVIVDEGFGSLDASNADKMVQLFTQIANNSKFILLISHLDILNSAISIPLYIDTSRRVAHINNEHVKPPEPTAMTIFTAATAAKPKISNASRLGGRTSKIETGDKIKCTCGAFVMQKGMSRHIQCASHKKAVAAAASAPNA